MANTCFKLMILFFLAMCTSVYAEYLVCDLPVQGDLVEYYEVDGLPEDVHSGRSIPRDETGEYGFKLDIGAMPITGNWHLVARACSSTLGCSANSQPFNYVKSRMLGSPSSFSGGAFQ